MTPSPFSIRLETPEDAAAIDHLHQVSFGPGRFAKAAFRVREGVPHDSTISFTATRAEEMIGSVRLTPILIGCSKALLLGPLAVVPHCKGQGAGRALMAACMEAAGQRGVDLVLLVGDAPYYRPFGFKPVPNGSIRFPAPVDPDRILLAELRGEGHCRPVGTVVAAPGLCA